MNLPKNRYYVDLDLPHQVNCNLEFLKSNCKISPIQRHWNKFGPRQIEYMLSRDLLDWFDSVGVSIPTVEVFFTKPNATAPWHIDMSPPQDHIKINWVWEEGTEGTSYMEYSEIDADLARKNTKKTIVGTEYILLDDSTVPVDRINLRGPTMINAGRPHRAHNLKPSGRWCLSTIPKYKGTDVRILWDDALKIFSKNLLV